MHVITQELVISKLLTNNLSENIMNKYQVNFFLLHSISALILSAATNSTMAFDQGELERKIHDSLYAKPVPNELKDPRLTPAEIQKKQHEMQQAAQQEQAKRATAKENRIKFLHEISYTAFSSLKDEGVQFGRVSSKVNDIVQMDASESFAVGKELRLSMAENPSYFCPNGADCIRIDSTTDTTRETRAPHPANSENTSSQAKSAAFAVSDCRITVYGSAYVPGTLPGAAQLGKWECDEFQGEGVKSQAVEAVRQFAVDQMRKGPSAPATELSRQMNNQAEQFFKNIISNMPK